MATFAAGAKEILPFDTLTIRNTIFEKNIEDYVIKNRGVLVLENCTFRSNELGSKNSKAIFSNEKIVAPISSISASIENCFIISYFFCNLRTLPVKFFFHSA